MLALVTKGDREVRYFFVFVRSVLGQARVFNAFIFLLYGPKDALVGERKGTAFKADLPFKTGDDMPVGVEGGRPIDRIEGFNLGLTESIVPMPPI